MTAQRYRLGNQVVLVQGKHAAALYDLFAGRIQRISTGLGDLMSSGVLRERRDGASAGGLPEQLSAKLVERGFLETCKDNGAEDYRFEHAVPRFPPLRTLSFEVGRDTRLADLARAQRLIFEAIETFSLGSFAFLLRQGFALTDELKLLALEVLAREGYVLCEFWGEAEGVLEELQACLRSAGHGNRAFVSTVSGGANHETGLSEDGRRFVWGSKSALSASALTCRPDVYHLLMTRGESFGCLHFDQEWRVYPDVSERNHQVGMTWDRTGLRSLLACAGLDRYWRFGKDKREKCRDCELRYACPNPLSSRSNPLDLASAPSNCGYSLERGAW